MQDEETAQAKLFYAKVCMVRARVRVADETDATCDRQLPQDIAKRYVLLLDPMLGECMSVRVEERS